MDTNPAMRAMFSNPDMMRNMMTPENIQAAMNMMQGSNGMGGLGAMGGAPGTF